MAEAGDIVAIMGIDCASGDTYSSEPKYCTLENIFVAKPGEETDGHLFAPAAVAHLLNGVGVSPYDRS